MGNTSTVNVRFLSVPRPNAENLVSQDAGETEQESQFPEELFPTLLLTVPLALQ